MINNVTPLILVKNEEYFLPYTLESIAGQFKQYVIYDVGSTDKTREILEWWIEKETRERDAEILHRFLPDCPPVVQGTFRNAMIAECQTPMYMIVDGDEVYNEKEFGNIEDAALSLEIENARNERIRYGLFRRLEFDQTMKMKYSEEREHHRLYMKSAFWTGTHPGEVAFYAQNGKTELDFKEDVRVFHFHNCLRSPDEEAAHKRMTRKNKKTYHPGKLQEYNLFKELPLLANPIKDWPITPFLAELQAVHATL